MGTSFGVWEACCGRGAMPRVTGLQPLPDQRPMLQVTCQAVEGGGTDDVEPRGNDVAGEGELPYNRGGGVADARSCVISINSI